MLRQDGSSGDAEHGMSVHPWVRDLPALDVVVTCGRDEHAVAWDPDLGLSFPDHPSVAPELALLALGGELRPGCVEVARAWERLAGTDEALDAWRPPDDDDDDGFADRADRLAELVGVRPSAIATSLRALRASPTAAPHRAGAGLAAHLDRLIDRHLMPPPLRLRLGVARLAEVSQWLDGVAPEPGRDPRQSEVRARVRALGYEWARWALARSVPLPARGRLTIDATYDAPAEAAIHVEGAGSSALHVEMDVGADWLRNVLRRGVALVGDVLVLDVADERDGGDGDALDASVVRWARARSSYRATVVEAVIERASDGWRLR